MSFTKIDALDNHIKSFFSPKDMMNFEGVSRLVPSSSWKKIGYNDKNEFIKIFKEIIKLKNKDSKKIVTDFVLNGRVNSQQVKEILKQGFFGKQWCTSPCGIQAIALGIFTPSQIDAMESFKRQWCLSKNGLELMKQGILTPDEIGNMDPDVRERLLGDKCTKMLIQGIMKKEQALKMTIEQLDKL